MTPAEEVERGMSILAATEQAIDEKLLELAVDRAGDTSTWCVVVAPAKGLDGAPTPAPGHEMFAVAVVPRGELAAEFERARRPDIAACVARLRVVPGRCLLVVTCRDLTQLHQREMPAVGPRGDA